MGVVVLFFSHITSYTFYNSTLLLHVVRGAVLDVQEISACYSDILHGAHTIQQTKFKDFSRTFPGPTWKIQVPSLLGRVTFK